MCFLKMHYYEVVQRDMILTEIVENVSVLASPTKIILSFGGENIEESYVLSCIFSLFFICGQKPYFIRQKVNDLSDGEVLGGKLTLRGFSMYNFLYRLLFDILPYMKHFEGFRGPVHPNIFSFIIKDVFAFEGLGSFFLYLNLLGFLQCQVHFTTKNNIEVTMLGQSLFFCFS
uniref:Ribosomal protein L5 n=1 Tax=Protohalopteris sp. TaxID=2843287 RepID=A0A8F0K0S0_9PHAE|nr:ribosomal protein L5 [Protohalopteris sp.]